VVRTYWLVPVFNEASGNLDLQPDRTMTKSNPIRPRAMSMSILTARRRGPGEPTVSSRDWRRRLAGSPGLEVAKCGR
jgi:hypothetical protein